MFVMHLKLGSPTRRVKQAIQSQPVARQLVSVVVGVHAVALLASLAAPSIAAGATITAANCSSSAVQTAINTASGGDVVVVPNGSCAWSAGVSISGKAV